MNTKYEYEFEKSDSLYSHFFGEFTFYLILIAVILKLLRADKMAGKSFNAAVMLPMVFAVYLLFPFVLSFGVLTILGVTNIFREIFSGISAILCCYFLITNGSSFDSSAIEKIKEFYCEITNESKAKTKLKKTHLEQLTVLDSQLESELNSKFIYQLYLLGFFVFLYIVFQDAVFFRGFYSFLNYNLYPTVKYPFLVVLYAAIAYAYSKYFDFYCSQIFKKISFLVEFLEREHKFVLIKHRNGYPRYEFSIQTENPWECRETTNYYYFVKSEDDKFAYWINTNLDFNHYKKVIPKLKIEGVERLLDSVVKKTKTYK